MTRKKILIVEDEQVLLDLYASLLLRQGRDAVYDVVKAVNFEEAESALAGNDFDLLLTDYHLPTRDGITLITMLKEKNPRTVSILISGYLTEAIIRSAREAGAAVCLKKPCSIQTIVETVGKALAPDGEKDEELSAENDAGAALPQAATSDEPASRKKPGARDFFLLLLDETGTIVHADEPFAAVCGRPLGEIISRPVTEFLYSYFLQYLAKQEIDFIRFAAANQEKQVTLDFVSGKPGRRRPIVCEFAVPGETVPAGWRVAVIGMDMEKRIELHRLIEFERESLRQLQSGQFDMVVTVDKDLRIKTINNNFLKKLDAKQRELVDRDFPGLLAKGRDRRAFEQAVRQAQAMKDVFNLRIDLCCNNRTIPALVNLSAVRDSFNDELGYVIVLRDIGRELKLEATLRGVERMQALGQLAAGVAHQINNYTNAVMGSADLLQDSIDDACAGDARKERVKREAHDLLAIIRESIQKLTGLTQHLTTFAHAQQPPVISAGDVNKMIRDILTLIVSRLSKKMILLETEFDESLPPVRFSPLHLEQAVLNVIMNAIDAVTEKKGRIIVSTYREHDWICIMVKDNGPGIPEEIRQEIFEAFFTTKPPGVGTGLGLNVARDVVESMKGTIDAESSPEEGTRMTIKIPLVTNGETTGEQ